MTDEPPESYQNEFLAMFGDILELEKRVARMNDDEFRAYLMNECFYQLARKLDDGVWIGLSSQLIMGHTVLAIDLDATGWRSQYWYQNAPEAAFQFLMLDNGQQIPENWTAKRPK